MWSMEGVLVFCDIHHTTLWHSNMCIGLLVILWVRYRGKYSWDVSTQTWTSYLLRPTQPPMLGRKGSDWQLIYCGICVSSGAVVCLHAAPHLCCCYKFMLLPLCADAVGRWIIQAENAFQRWLPVIAPKVWVSCVYFESGEPNLKLVSFLVKCGKIG